MGLRNYPSLAVFSGDPRGAVHARSNGRRRPSKLSAETKWEIFLQVTSGEIAQAEAARKWGVDVSTVIGIRRTVKDAALAALARKSGSSWHATRLAARSRPSGDRAAHRGGQGAGHRAGGRAGKSRLGLSGRVPVRVPAEVKELVLKSVDDAVAAGFAHTWACALWQISDERVHRWRARRRDDRHPGRPGAGRAPGARVAARGDRRDPRRRRTLGHRRPLAPQARAPRLLPGQLVWVSPATSAGSWLRMACPCPHPQPRSHEREAAVAGLAGVGAEPDLDLGRHAFHPRPAGGLRDRRHGQPQVDRHAGRVEETATQVQVLFEHALQLEGLLELLTDARLDLDPDDPRRPILLAVSDNGPPMTAHDTRAFMALMAIAQHHGRPRTPTDQAWIESFFGHVKGEWPHLETIADPSLLQSELGRVRTEYNAVRLHEAIGYVTPNDEHAGWGEAIRQARRDGLDRARQRRLDYHRRTSTNPTGEMP